MSFIGMNRWFQSQEQRLPPSWEPLFKRETRYFKMEPRIGFEPTTYALRMRCSTNWAISAFHRNKLTDSPLGGNFWFERVSKIAWAWTELQNKLCYHSSQTSLICPFTLALRSGFGCNSHSYKIAKYISRDLRLKISNTTQLFCSLSIKGFAKFPCLMITAWMHLWLQWFGNLS